MFIVHTFHTFHTFHIHPYSLLGREMGILGICHARSSLAEHAKRTGLINSRGVWDTKMANSLASPRNIFWNGVCATTSCVAEEITMDQWHIFANQESSTIINIHIRIIHDPSRLFCLASPSRLLRPRWGPWPKTLKSSLKASLVGPMCGTIASPCNSQNLKDLKAELTLVWPNCH